MLKRLLPFLVPACLFLLVFGFKLDVVHRYGSDLPRWDQLDAEGLAVFVPLAEHRLGPADIFRAHNEHRIVWTKLLGLAELQLNGQWDARIQCTVNAVLHSAMAVLVLLFAFRNLDRRFHAPAFALIALLFGLPLAWENPLAGFHSQQYFLLGFSFGAIVLFPPASAWSSRWWAGTLCILAALFTMGSGLFAAAIVVGVMALQGWRSGNVGGIFNRATPTVTVCAAALILGALGRVSVNYHEMLKAGSVADFLLYSLHCFQWPAQNWCWLALILWLPVAGLAWRMFRRQDQHTGYFPLTLLGLAAWVVLQIFATAYTRGAAGGMPSSRYADTFALGLVVNGLALAWLWPRLGPNRWRTVAGVAWILTVACTAYVQGSAIFRQVLPENRRYLEACEENVRRYLASGDSTHLDTEDIPYPGIRALRERIDLPAIRAILPVSVRLPITLATAGDAGPFAAHSTVRLAQRFTAPPGQLPAVLGALPKLEQRIFWFADPAKGAGEWRSVPLHFTRPSVLRILVAGVSGPNLSLLDAGSGAPLADVISTGISPDQWRSVHVAVPAGDVVFRARVAKPGDWLAFSEPVEMARGSYWCWRLVRTGRLIWLTAAAASLLVGLGAWYCARAEKALG